MYFGIYDECTVTRYKPQGERPLLIRVLEPCYKNIGIPWELQYKDNYIDILELYFEDINRYSDKLNNEYTLFNKEMVYKIIKFIENNDFDEIVVHCSAGISRSSAVMIVVSRILGINEIERMICSSKHYLPNKLVIKTFEEVNYKIKALNYEHKNLINTNEIIYKDKSSIKINGEYIDILF